MDNFSNIRILRTPKKTFGKKYDEKEEKRTEKEKKGGGKQNNNKGKNYGKSCN